MNIRQSDLLFFPSPERTLSFVINTDVFTEAETVWQCDMVSAGPWTDFYLCRCQFSASFHVLLYISASHCVYSLIFERVNSLHGSGAERLDSSFHCLSMRPQPNSLMRSLNKYVLYDALMTSWGFHTQQAVSSTEKLMFLPIWVERTHLLRLHLIITCL